MIGLTGIRNKSSRSFPFVYKVQVCGEYVPLFLWAGNGVGYQTQHIEKAREIASRFIASEGKESVSIHAFDRSKDVFSHVVRFTSKGGGEMR